MNSVEHSPEFAVVEDVFRAHVADFAARAFSLTNVTVDHSRVIRSITFHFSSVRASLLLDISFFLGRSGLKQGFNAMISKPDNRKLDVKDYLALHGRSDLAESFTTDAATDLRGFAESTVQMLIRLLDGELKPIVEGKAWEETPVDWQGYK